MAINENPELPTRHVFVAAKTGGGKSQAIRNLIVPRNGIRAVFWDIDKDHNCTHYTNRKAFLQALKSANESDKPFRIGWAGDGSRVAFEFFCVAVWRILDGKKDTWIITEELADLNMLNRIPPAYNTLSKRSRKYGGILVGNTQRIQEIPKTFVTQAASLWIGKHDFQDAAYIEKMTGYKKERVQGLQELEFIVRDRGEERTIKVKYKRFKRVLPDQQTA